MSLLPETKKQVDDYVKSSKVFLASKTYCQYCRKAKEICRQFGIKPVVVELDEVDEGPAIQAYLKEMTGQSTVPFVFVNGKFIGGSSDFVKLAENGELKSLL